MLIKIVSILCLNEAKSSLPSCISKKDQRRERGGEVVCMFLEYIVQTLEDDFYLKRSSSSLSHSLAKATLSCDQQFPRVR